jgi:hypothetical protein
MKTVIWCLAIAGSFALLARAGLSQDSTLGSSTDTQVQVATDSLTPGTDGTGVDAATTTADRITWVGGIQGSFQSNCFSCHPWAQNYPDVVTRIELGTLQQYLDQDHFITGDAKQQVVDWITVGYPEQ